MRDSRLSERIAGVRSDLRGAISDLVLVESTASRSGAVELAPVEEALRRAIREVGRIRSDAGDPRPPQAGWWECADCRAKLASVTALTLTIIRKDLTVYVGLPAERPIIVACPRCRNEQEFSG